MHATPWSRSISTPEWNSWRRPVSQWRPSRCTWARTTGAAAFLRATCPALGYRVYRLKSSTAGAPAAEQGRDLKTANTVENDFYRVTVDPGRSGVTSIFDKQMHREIVDAKSPYLLNQYLYVSGGDGTRLVYMRDHLPNAELRITPAGGGAVATVHATPWG